MIKSSYLVRYREYVSNGKKVKKPDDINLMIDNQFIDWPHSMQFHEDGSKIYSFEYEGINYKATHVWYEDPPEGFVADVTYNNVVYNEELDKFVVTAHLPVPVEESEPPTT